MAEIRDLEGTWSEDEPRLCFVMREHYISIYANCVSH